MPPLNKKILNALLEQFKQHREELEGESYETRRRAWFDKRMVGLRDLLASPEAIDKLTESNVAFVYKRLSIGGPKLYPKTFLDNGVDRIKASLKFLLYRTEVPLADRFYQFVEDSESEYRLNGIGKAFASTALLLLDSKKYGIWNGASEGGLAMLSRLPEKRRGEHKGQRYMQILEALNQVREDCGFDDFNCTDEFVELIYHGKLTLPEESAPPESKPVAPDEDKTEDNTHDHMQWLLIQIGRLKGHDVWVARNDRNKSYNKEPFSSLCLEQIPHFAGPNVLRIAELIDVIWFKKNSAQPVGFFEIEHSTSIYSGLLRLNDVRIDYPITEATIVASNQKRSSFEQQLARRTFEYSELSDHCSFKTYEEIKEWFSHLSRAREIERGAE